MKRIKIFFKLLLQGKISLSMPRREIKDVVTMYLVAQMLKGKTYEDIMK